MPPDGYGRKSVSGRVSGGPNNQIVDASRPSGAVPGTISRGGVLVNTSSDVKVQTRTALASLVFLRTIGHNHPISSAIGFAAKRTKSQENLASRSTPIKNTSFRHSDDLDVKCSPYKCTLHSAANSEQRATYLLPPSSPLYYHVGQRKDGYAQGGRNDMRGLRRGEWAIVADWH